MSLISTSHAGRFRVWKNFNTRIAVLHLVPGFEVKVRFRSAIMMLGSG
jgi:hypothetical protein